jgi:uncharacterized protein YdaU (DUF1376 family)
MKLYVGDYLGDTLHLGALEHGAYLLLLMAMWRAGGRLPAKDENLAKIARCTAKEWASIRATVLPFFKAHRGLLTHKRLAAEIAKYEYTSGKRSEAGKQGGEKTARKNKQLALAFAGAKSKQLPTYPEPEPEPKKERELTLLIDGAPLADRQSDFEAWWSAYPKRVGKLAARKAYDKARKDGASAAALLAGLRDRGRWSDDPRFIPNPATWLNQGRWDDETTEQPRRVGFV